MLQTAEARLCCAARLVTAVLLLMLPTCRCTCGQSTTVPSGRASTLLPTTTNARTLRDHTTWTYCTRTSGSALPSQKSAALLPTSHSLRSVCLRIMCARGGCVCSCACACACVCACMCRCRCLCVCVCVCLYVWFAHLCFPVCVRVSAPAVCSCGIHCNNHGNQASGSEIDIMGQGTTTDLANLFHMVLESAYQHLSWTAVSTSCAFPPMEVNTVCACNCRLRRWVAVQFSSNGVRVCLWFIGGNGRTCWSWHHPDEQWLPAPHCVSHEHNCMALYCVQPGIGVTYCRLVERAGFHAGASDVSANELLATPSISSDAFALARELRKL